MMTRHLLRTLELMDKRRRSDDRDWLIMVIGRRGTGKSTLILYGASKIASQENIHIVNTPREFLSALNATNQYGIIMYDEGLRGMMSRDAMTTENKEQIKAIAQMRQGKNLMVFMITQDISMMERHVRFTACDGILRCVRRRGKPGLVLGYGPNKIGKIKVKDNIPIYPKPSWRDSFPTMKGTKIWEDYKEIEGKKKNESTLEGIAKIDRKNAPRKTESQFEKEFMMRNYFMQLRKRQKSLRESESLIKRKFGESPSYRTLARWLKK